MWANLTMSTQLRGGPTASGSAAVGITSFTSPVRFCVQSPWNVGDFLVLSPEEKHPRRPRCPVAADTAAAVTAVASPVFNLSGTSPVLLFPVTQQLFPVMQVDFVCAPVHSAINNLGFSAAVSVWQLQIAATGFFQIFNFRTSQGCVASHGQKRLLLIAGLYMVPSSPGGVITTFPSDACLAKQF